VCGSRHDGPPAWVHWVYRALDGFDQARHLGHVIQGGARGYDLQAQGWSKARKRTCTTFWPDWDEYGPGAGPKRNEEMLRFLVRITRPDRRLILAFPGGRGTASMVGLGKEAHVPVWCCAMVGRDGFEWALAA